MKVIMLSAKNSVYSCNAYLILGDWNAISDVNTLIDTGVDSSIIDEIEKISTGVGKRPVEQVILTHGHFDHTGGLASIVKKYRPRVLAHNIIEGVNEKVLNGQVVRVGDRYFDVLHTPGHSNDSICIYCHEEKVLFSGDTPLNIKTPGGSYTSGYVQSLEKIAGLEIETIYTGHDLPIVENASGMIRNTLSNVKKSHLV